MNDDDLTLSGRSAVPRQAPGPERWDDPGDLRWSRPRPAPEWEADYRRDRRARRRPGLLAAVFLSGVLVFCLAFVSAPLFAFRAMRSAAQYGDVRALGQLVDYDAVRQSLRVQVRPASAEREPPASLLRDPLGALRRAWEPVTPQEDVNLYLSPEALASLAAGRGRSGALPADRQGFMAGPFPGVRFWGFRNARLGVADPDLPGRETIFTLERRGLFNWRLVGIGLPGPTGAGAAS